MASFTTTSPFSGSVWDGTTGCPIISPSNWQRLVLDNLEVLANHDHSGSAGEGTAVLAASFFPTIDNDYFSAMFPTASSGTVTLQTSCAVGGTNNTFLRGGVVLAGDGSTAEYDVYLRSGVYSVGAYVFGVGATGGVLVYLDSACIGSLTLTQLDGNGGIRIIDGASVTGAGERRLKVIHSASIGSGASFMINYFMIRRVSA